jgi:flagellar biosynthesis/type III secretory pathway M-ring protein FliF/YscJ
MSPEQEKLLRQTFELSQQNNRMLHAMRRNALLGGIVKFIFYILILVVAPLWVYTTYLQPLVQNLEKTNAQTQAQFTALQDTWKAIESKIPGFSSTSTQ